MKNSNKERLIEIYLKMDRQREFNEHAMFDLKELVFEAIRIVEKIDKNSTCYKNLLKSQMLWENYKSIPSNKITQTIIDRYSMDVIQLSQYSIKEFSDKC